MSLSSCFRVLAPPQGGVPYSAGTGHVQPGSCRAGADTRLPVMEGPSALPATWEVL